MAVDTSLAQLSNTLVYASMAAYTGSFIAFAASMAAGRGRAEVDDQASSTKRVVAAGSSKGGAVTLAAKQRVTAAAGATTTTTARPMTENDEADTELPVIPGRKAGNIGTSLMWLATLMLAGGVIARGVSAGRPPWGNMYEFSLASAFAVSAAYLGISTRRDVRWLGVFVSGAVLLTLGTAVTVLYTESAQLVPALKSYWLAIHVSAAIICAGAFTVGAFVTVLYLVRDRAEKKAAAAAAADKGDGQVHGWLSSRVPDADRLDAMAYRINAFVFPLWTFAVIAGAIWAENAWGRYWGWDPKETWAFITWVVYAGYLHARATAGWRGRKAAVIGLVGYGAFLFNYFGVNMFVSGLHSYAGVK